MTQRGGRGSEKETAPKEGERFLDDRGIRPRSFPWLRGLFLCEFRDGAALFEAAQMIHEHDAVQVIRFVLHADAQEFITVDGNGVSV